jgi:pimeloyl-ACP methyl ester carboxylesterase
MIRLGTLQLLSSELCVEDHKSQVAERFRPTVIDMGSTHVLKRRSASRRSSSSKTVVLKDGRKVNVEIWPGKGRPYVLVHGLLASSKDWTDVAGRMTRPCYAVDLPGFGASDMPSQDSVDSYASDVTEALQNLNIRKFTLVGHSLGGAVAAAVAEALVHEVIQLVLISPIGFGKIFPSELSRVPLVPRGFSVLLKRTLRNDLATKSIYSTLVTNGVTPSEDLLVELREHADKLAEGAVHGIRTIRDAGDSHNAIYKRQLRYSGPVKVLWGSHDVLVPLWHSKNLRGVFPQADLTVWKNMGHHPQRERLGDLVGFLTEAVAT